MKVSLFMEEGKFKQKGNMRTGEIESHEGTWKVSDDVSKPEMLQNEQTINIQQAGVTSHYPKNIRVQ